MKPGSIASRGSVAAPDGVSHAYTSVTFSQAHVKKAHEYRQHARECRDLARRMSNEEERRQLLGMADRWDLLAVQRERLLELHGDEDAVS